MKLYQYKWILELYIGICSTLVVEIVHLTTSLTNGAGKAARRINAAINEVGGISSLITTGRIDGGLSPGERRETPGIAQSKVSKSLTVLQNILIKKSEFPMTPISIQSLDLRNFNFSKYDVVNLHATYNLLSVNSLKILASSAQYLVLTLHDERAYTGGCHNTLDCENFLHNCEDCPLATKFGQIVVAKSFQYEKAALANSANRISVVAPSEWIFQKASRSNKFGRYQISRIPNPIPEKIYTFREERLNRFISHSKFTIGFIAADLGSPFKGFTNLISAINLMGLQERDSYRLLLVGKKKNTQIPTEIEVLHKESSDDFEVAELLRAIDLLVVPSLRDNSPSVISEALMCGTKVIGSDRGGIPEMLDYNENLIFNAESPYSLLEKIRLNTKFHEKQEISKLAHDKYSSSVVGRRYLDFYRQLNH